MMTVRRSFILIFVSILVCKTVFVSSRSHKHLGKQFTDDNITSTGVLKAQPVDHVKRRIPTYDASNTKQWKFTDIASKIKEVIDKIQPDEVASKLEGGFHDIDINYNLFHGTANDVGDSPIRRLVLVEALSTTITIVMKEVESDMCPLSSTVSDAQIGEKVLDVIGSIKEFQAARRRIAKLSQPERLAEAESLGRNGTYADSKNFKTPGGHLLKARLQELVDLYVPSSPLPVPEDDLTVLCAMADGTFTYILRMLSSLDLQSYLADSFYKTGNLEEYNNYFNLLVSNFRDVRNSLVGSDSDEPIIQNVLTAMRGVVDDEDFQAVTEKSNAEKIARKIISLAQIKSEIEGIGELPLIIDVPEKLMGKPDFEDKPIKTPLGPWQDGANVTYAVQYRQNGMLSKLGEWMDPITVSGEANPILRIRVHPKRFDRLIFRKFNNKKPQLVGVLEDKYQTEFRDVNRDLYDAAARFDKNSLDDAEILINNGADINAVFEGGRRAIHAAALSDNIKIAKKFLINTESPTDNVDIGVNVADHNGYTPMHVASEAGNRRFVQFLLESRGEVNAKTYNTQWTPIHIAADRGFVSSVKTLLNSSVIDVNSPDIGGFSPLHRAVSGGIPVLELLMADSRTDFQAKSAIGLTPLMIAVMEEYEDITAALLNNDKVNPNSKTDVNMTALTFASLLGNTEIVKQLLQKNDIDVNCKTVDGWTPLNLAVALRNSDAIRTFLSKPINQTNELTSSNISPLHIAVVTEQKEIVKDLITHGASIDEPTESGLAPIHLALLHKKFEIFNILIDGGADIQAKSFDGSSLLHFAIANNKFDIIESLVKKGVDINAKNIITGETPLHTAVRHGYLEVVTILVQHGADVNAKNKQGETPLHYIAASPDGIVDILNFLTSNGADVDLTDNLDRTALHSAVKSGNLVKVESLIKKGATVDCKDHLGVTPLHMVAGNGKENLFECLLNNSASVDITDNEGRTPLHQAVRNRHESAVRSLLRKAASLDIKDLNLQTPLHVAVIHNDSNIFPIVHEAVRRDGIYRVATDFASNPYLNSPFHLAIVLGRNEIVRAMYYGRARDDIYNNNLIRQSIIETAAATGKLEVIDQLNTILGSLFNSNLAASLCTAAQYGHPDIVDIMLMKGANINGDLRRDKNNIPICCVKGNLYMIEHLISKGADINMKCVDGLTPLHRAANAGYTDIVKLLLKHLNREYDHGNQKLLQIMAQSGRMDEVKALVDQGAVLNSTALGGVTSLHIMAQSGSLREVKDLVDRGSLTNTTTLKGEAPLHFAAKGGKVDIISYLTSKDADINAADTNGRTPLHWALEISTELKVVKTLIRHGALVNHKCLQGKTPLHTAVSRHSSLEVILYLITEKADVNAKDYEGNTPLFDAVRRGNIEIVKKLVDEGADVTILNNYEESPLHYVTAVPNSRPFHKTDNYNEHLFKTVNQPAMDMVNYLMSKGAKI